MTVQMFVCAGLMLALTQALGCQRTATPSATASRDILLALKRPTQAIAPLSRAATVNPLPEYQWALADALRVQGRLDAAAAVELEIAIHGALGQRREARRWLNKAERLSGTLLPSEADELSTQLRDLHSSTTSRRNVTRQLHRSRPPASGTLHLAHTGHRLSGITWP